MAYLSDFPCDDLNKCLITDVTKPQTIKSGLSCKSKARSMQQKEFHNLNYSIEKDKFG